MQREKTRGAGWGGSAPRRFPLEGRMRVRELWNQIKEGYLRNLRLVLQISGLSVACLLLILFARGQQEAQILELPPPLQIGPILLVTAEQMDRMTYQDSVLGELKWVYTNESLLELNRVLLAYGIREPEEISQFLAQAAVETGAGRRLTESGDEAYFQSRGYTTGTRGAGYLHLTHEYGQMAFSTWMMKYNVPELAHIPYYSPSSHGTDEIAGAYYGALRTAANMGLDISRYSRIVFDPYSTVSTGADYIAQVFAWESAGYYWHIAGIGEALSPLPGVENVDIASARVGGSNWQSRREAYMAFYPVLSNSSYQRKG